MRILYCYFEHYMSETFFELLYNTIGYLKTRMNIINYRFLTMKHIPAAVDDAILCIEASFIQQSSPFEVVTFRNQQHSQSYRYE
jgi:hypothetical protein